MSRRRIGAAALAVIAVIVVVVLLFGSSGSGSGSGHLASGQPAPLFQTFDLQGKSVALKDFKGRRVVLNFWASWCEPCRTEFPVLKRLQATQPHVAVIGVVFEDGDSPARAFLKAEGATWPGVRDPAGAIAAAYDVHAKPGIPVSVLIGPDGSIRGRQTGPLTDDSAAKAFVDQAPLS